MTYGDLATVLRLLAANQRRLVEMLRRIDPQPRAWYDAYEAMLANLAKADDLLSWERSVAPTDDPLGLARWLDDGGPEGGAVVAPEIDVPDPAQGRERHT